MILCPPISTRTDTLFPYTTLFRSWLVMLPIVVWGAAGWALQVPQNNELILVRQAQGDGNLAIALNESALYLGSAIGAAVGGFVLLLQMPTWTLAVSAGAVAALGADRKSTRLNSSH